MNFYPGQVCDISAMWQGRLSAAGSGASYVERASGALVCMRDGSHVAAFRSEIGQSGAVGFVKAETAHHRIVIEAEPEVFMASVNEHIFMQVSRTNGEVWEGLNKCVGEWVRFCDPSKTRPVSPCIFSDSGSAALSHLRWGTREIATLQTGPGRAHGRACVQGRRIVSARLENDREEMMAFLAVLIETCFFGVIGMPLPPPRAAKKSFASPRSPENPDLDVALRIVGGILEILDF